MMAKPYTQKERRDIIIVTAITLLLPLFSIYIHLSERLYDFSREYKILGISEYLINFCFLYLSGLLYLTYHRWLKAEKKRKELENIIASINPDVLIVVDQRRKIMVCNGTIQRMFGYHVDEAVQQTTDLLYFDRRSYPEDNKREIYEALEKEGFHAGLATGKKKNGETFPLEIITGNLSGEQGAVLLLRDITTRKEAENALRESEDRFHAMFEQAGDGVFILNTNGKIISVNETFARMHGFTMEEMQRRGLEELDVEWTAAILDRLCRVMAGETLTFEVEHQGRAHHPAVGDSQSHLFGQRPTDYGRSSRHHRAKAGGGGKEKP